jgi:hypothetical protein
MPRGSRPGERRGGRQRGTPNKKTLLKNAVFCAVAADPDRSPLDFMLALMRDPQGPLDLRLEMAAAAAPFVHARPRPPSRSRPHPMAVRARSAKADAPNGGEDGAVASGEGHPTLQPDLPGGGEKTAIQSTLPEADEKPSLEPDLSGEQKSAVQAAFAGGHEKPTPQPAIPGRPEKSELAGGDERAVRLTAVGSAATRPSALRPLSPLEFLMAVMTDPEAAPRQRIRAAQVAARYKHKTADAQAPAEPVEDEFGFRIDPQVAKTIREVVQECDYLADLSDPSRADVQKHRGLLRYLHEQIATVGCSQVYGWANLKNDETRLEKIRELKTRQHKLPPEVDAEEAYLITRVEVFRASPMHQAWCRVSALEVSRARGNTLTDAEISELESLPAGFPIIAQQFANRDWSQYVWDSPVSSIIDRIEEFRRLKARGATPEEIEKHRRQREASILEAQERAEISRRGMDYLNERLESSKKSNPRLKRFLLSIRSRAPQTTRK